MEKKEGLSVALCLLTWNEIDGCKKDIPKIDMEMFDQVYAVDGGSSDGTIEYIKDQGIDVLVQPTKGYNSAYLYAFQQCNCDALILFHPKGTVPIEDLYKFRKYFESGYSLVVASRLLKESRNEEDEYLLRPRKWFIRMVALFSYLTWGNLHNKVLWDVLHGFRGMVVSDFKRMSILEQGISVDIEMVVRVYKNKLKYIEFSTKETSRKYGETHFPAIVSGWRILMYLLHEIGRKV